MNRLLVILSIFLASLASARAEGVGFTRIMVDDPMGGQMRVSIWYPTESEGGRTTLGPFTIEAARDAVPAEGTLGLVVLSHGNAGSDLGHRNVARALAKAGFIAAAPLHPRNNYQDNSGVGRRAVMEGRPRQISAVIEALLGDPLWRERIDPQRIGAFGFSLGGYTVLTLLGAQPEIARIVAYCEGDTDDPFCGIGGDLADHMRTALSLDGEVSTQDLSDPRICAAVIADPVAIPFSDEELASIEVRHIQLWRPEHQDLLFASAHGGRGRSCAEVKSGSRGGR